MRPQPPSVPPIGVRKAAAYTVDCSAFGPGHKHTIVCGLFGPPHRHPDMYQLVYVWQGTGWVRIGARTEPVSPRDLYLVKPNEVHSSEAEENAVSSLWDVRFEIARPEAVPVDPASLPDILPQVTDPALVKGCSPRSGRPLRGGQACRRRIVFPNEEQLWIWGGS